MPRRDPLTPLHLEERTIIPFVWFIVLGLVGAGIVVHILMAIFWSGGMVIWPFIFSVAVLILLNDASDQNAAGIPPFQVYALFAGTLIGFFAFVMLVSRTINPWLLVLMVIGLAAYLVRDWRLRKEKERELVRRRLAGLCVRCCRPVGDGIEDTCPNCGTPVNPERMDLFRLGKAISLRAASRPGNARSVLSGAKPSRADMKMHNLMQQRATRHKRGK